MLEAATDISEWFDSPGDIAAIVTIIIGVITALTAAILFLVRGQIAQSKVLGSNGSSVVESLDLIKDSLNRMHSDMSSRDDRLERRLETLDTTNTSQHEQISARLDAHAASPVHDRRNGPRS